MHTLASLFALRQYLGISSTDTQDDPRLVRALQTATHTLHRENRRTFSPHRATHYHSLNLCDVREICLEDDLLALISITNGDNTPIPLTDVIVLYDSVLHLLNNRYFVYDDSPINAIAVTAIWGWHNDWTRAWRNSNDSPQTALNSSQSTISVADADGVDGDNSTPRFSIGDLLRCEDEYMVVIGVNITTNVLTVARGAHGTLASTHAQNTPVYRYQPPADVVNACLQVATACYTAPDQTNPQTPPVSEWVRLQV
jgi:hypothetical protein